MTADRWATIERLYHEALERAADARPAFLANACGGDEALRRDVESLLAHDGDASFLSTPAVAVAEPRALVPGQRLGPYMVTGSLGQGGMGEVYRACDTKLRRDVAIKILPRLWLADPDRRARFDREAVLLASLNHPHIGAIYGVEDTDEVRALVLELVEGPMLADRLAKGPMPVSESLAIATQIADALDAAHSRGVVHRDLKPANIKIAAGGVVKVLDFGLAKIAAADPVSGHAGGSRAPTVDATREGLIVGTAGYMSPEQARGQQVDKRTDIWAFGCVLYEMLTGRAPFAGATISDSVAAILARDPSWEALPSDLPRQVHRLLKRCLEKDPKLRLRDIGDARGDLEADTALPERDRRRAAASVWLVAGALALAVLTTAAVWALRPRALIDDANGAIRLDVLPPAGMEFAVGFGIGALSPDGAHIAFVARTTAGDRLFVRALDSGTVRELPDTEGAQLPFWSPDSSAVAFFAAGKLKRMDLAGGAPAVIANAPSGGRGGSWNREGIILFNGVNDGPLLRVDANGGMTTALTEVDAARTENSHRYPVFLPDGRRFLYFIRATDATKSGIYLGSIDRPNEKRQLVSSAFSGVYATVHGNDGYLVWLRDGMLVAQRLDLERGSLVGKPISIVGEVEATPNTPSPVSVSSVGRLLYTSVPLPEYQITMYSREGRPLSVVGTPDHYTMMTLSPDGKRLALSRNASGGSDIWMMELARGIPTRIVSSGQINAWSPDGQRIVYTTGAPPNLFIAAPDGSGGERPAPSRSAQSFANWSTDGRYIIYAETANDPSAATRSDLRVWAVDERRVIPYLQTPSGETHARFSPDGKWIAYISDESGRDELYVQSFPTGRGKWRVSTLGAAAPSWTRDGNELLFAGPDHMLMAVTLRVAAGGLEFDRPRALFRLPNGPGIVPSGGLNRSAVAYEIAADGERIIALAAAGGVEQKPSVHVIVNWPAIVRGS